VKKFVALYLLLIMPAMLSAQNGAGDLEPKKVKLERGKVLDLSLITPLDSGRAQVGDEITFKLERDLDANGSTVLPKNFVVRGRITKVVRAGKNCKDGRVRWKLEPMRTASGRKFKVQPIAKYLAELRGGEVVDRVSLETTGEKIARNAPYATMLPIVVLLSPALILFAIALSHNGDCQGTPGQEETVLPETHFYFAVSRDVRIVQASALPHGCDTPETVTDSAIQSTHCY
jgi:hypothetical protein